MLTICDIHYKSPSWQSLCIINETSVTACVTPFCVFHGYWPVYRDVKGIGNTLLILINSTLVAWQHIFCYLVCEQCEPS